MLLPYFAACTKCEPGFREATAEGLRIWKEEFGLNKGPMVEQMQGTLEKIEKTECPLLIEKLEQDRNIKMSCATMAEMLKDMERDPDTRYASPETTWKTFITALRNGDREEAISCFNWVARQEYALTLERFNDAALNDMADDMAYIELGPVMDTVREGFVSTDGRAGVVLFHYYRGEWRISQL